MNCSTGETQIISSAGVSVVTLLIAAINQDRFIVAKKAFEDGDIYPGLTPILIIIAGAIGGTIFSIGFESLMLCGKNCTTDCDGSCRKKIKEIPLWRICTKLVIQPVFAIIMTTPLLKLFKIEMTEVTLIGMSFVIGTLGVYVLAKFLPYFENKLLPIICTFIESSLLPMIFKWIGKKVE